MRALNSLELTPGVSPKDSEDAEGPVLSRTPFPPVPSLSSVLLSSLVCRRVPDELPGRRPTLRRTRLPCRRKRVPSGVRPTRGRDLPPSGQYNNHSPSVN